VVTGAVAGGQPQVGGDGGLGADEPGARLVHADVLGAGGEGGEAAADVGGVQFLVRQPPPVGGGAGARHGAAAGRADHQPAGDGEQVGVGVAGQPLPQLVGAQQQRDVVGVLEVRLADDARPAVAGPAVVGGPVAVEPEDAQAARREVVGGGGAHAAEADDGDVVGGGHVRALLSVLRVGQPRSRVPSGSTRGPAATVAARSAPK
jgi:hypothetical protein